MISLDSPVASVLGAQTKQGKAKKITDGLGLRTVGDLLHHFPAATSAPASSTTVKALRSGEMLTVVGEITESDVHTYLDRRTRRTAYRLDTTPRPTVPRCGCRSSPSPRASPTGSRTPGGRASGRVHRPGQHLQGAVAAHQPHDGAVRVSDDETWARPWPRSGTVPAPPAHQGRRVVGPPAGGGLRAHHPRRGARPAARRAARGPRVARPRHRAAVGPPARHLGAGDLGATAVPVRRGAGDPAGAGRAGPSWRSSVARRAAVAGCWRPSTRGCRSRSPAGRRRCRPRSRPTSRAPIR